MFILSFYDEETERNMLKAFDSRKEFMEFIGAYPKPHNLGEVWHLLCNFGVDDLSLVLTKRVYEPIHPKDTAQHTLWTAINMAKVGQQISVQSNDWDYDDLMFTILSAAQFT